MSIALKDGERRQMRPAPWANKTVAVTAYREDVDTPYVILEQDSKQLFLTDGEAWELIARLKRALSVLPTSK